MKPAGVKSLDEIERPARLERALARHRAGDRDGAEALYRAMLAADARDADALHLVGVLADERGESARAVEWIEQAIAIRGKAQYHCNLARALGHLGRHEDAVAHASRALAARPGYPEALNTLGASYRALGRGAEAEAAYRGAVAARPDYVEAWTNLGHALHAGDRLVEAEAAFRRALALRPAEAERYDALAAVLGEQDRPEEALAVLDLGAALAGAGADIDHHRALRLLSLGRFAEGWELYDRRFGIKQAVGAYARFAARPPWRGEPLDGRAILLVPEQGLGDTIQFARFAPPVAARGGRVILGAPAPLARLLRGMAGVAEVVTTGEAAPPRALHCPLMSLPRAFGTTLETIPAEIPYLRPDRADVARWRDRLDAGAPGRRVGIVWAGNPNHLNDRKRSLPFAALAPLWQAPGVRWFSLQVGERALDRVARDAPPPCPITDLAPDLTDFAETSAALAALDLLISVDTSVAHLAGAMGAPAWLLLPRVPDWRWLRAGAASPWYPTLRLFRQDDRRAWPPLVEEVADALRGWARV